MLSQSNIKVDSIRMEWGTRPATQSGPQTA